MVYNPDMKEKAEGTKECVSAKAIRELKNHVLEALNFSGEYRGRNPWRLKEETRCYDGTILYNYKYEPGKRKSIDQIQWQTLVEINDDVYNFKVIRRIKTESGLQTTALEFGKKRKYYLQYVECLVVPGKRNDLTGEITPESDMEKARKFVMDIPHPANEMRKSQARRAAIYFARATKPGGEKGVISIAFNSKFKRR